MQPDEVTGIVLIDEVDKHLHIKLQKEVLPSLLNIFPNVQFIVSSHSPFLSLGLAEKLQKRSKLVDIESGLSIQPTHDKQYQEVYEMMIGENQRYKTMYDSIISQIEDEKELQIITEGKNTEHIKKAINTALQRALAVLKGNTTKAMGSVMGLITMAHSSRMLTGSLAAWLMMDMFQLGHAFSFGALIMILGTGLFFFYTYHRKEKLLKTE